MCAAVVSVAAEDGGSDGGSPQGPVGDDPGGLSSEFLEQYGGMHSHSRPSESQSRFKYACLTHLLLQSIGFVKLMDK
eukprot:scaffold655719_cov36-Prasinocladus_malaysianus.AAC.1